MPACIYCGIHKNSRANIKRHIKQSPTCQDAFIEQISQFNVHAAGVDSDEDFSDAGTGTNTGESAAFSDEEHDFTVHGEQLAPSLSTEERGRSPYVEEIADEGDRQASNEGNRPRWNGGAEKSQYVGPYPHPAGTPMNISHGSTKFETIFKNEGEGGPWGEFKTEGEWELAKWLLQNAGHNQIAKFLDLPIVRSHNFCQ
jgi:hypothetical protein